MKPWSGRLVVESSAEGAFGLGPNTLLGGLGALKDDIASIAIMRQGPKDSRERFRVPCADDEPGPSGLVTESPGSGRSGTRDFGHLSGALDIRHGRKIRFIADDQDRRVGRQFANSR